MPAPIATTFQNKTYPSVAAMCKAHNVPVVVYYSRVYRYGWTQEEALGLVTRKQIREDMGVGSVYLLLNTKTGEAYVGITSRSIKKRVAEHMSLRFPERKLSRAIQLYGQASFIVQTIATGCSRERMQKLERRFIELFDSIENGYNVKAGGNLGSIGGGTEITFRGIVYPTIVALCQAYNASYYKFMFHRSKGRPIARCLQLKPIKYVNSMAEAVEFRGKRYDSHKDLCREYGVPYTMFIQRVNRFGWTVEKALSQPSKKISSRVAIHPDLLGD